MPGIAIYAGSFDPPTLGHLWMIERGAAMFDRLTVAVGMNPDKQSAYPVELREQWLRQLCEQLPNVDVVTFGPEFLARFADRCGARYILRGIRNESDYTYERAMRNVNADLSPKTTTVFLMPPRDMAEVSSSLVKGMIGPTGWRDIVKQYVPACVFDHLSRTND